MIFTTPLPFIKEFSDQLDQGIRACAPRRKLSKAQRWWLSFCLMGILLSNSRCWAAFERVGLGGYQQAALAGMFRCSKLLWPLLLHVSILLVWRRYGITEGVLAGDDSDRQRAQVTQRIFGAHQVFDQKTGGYVNGQPVVLLFLITPTVSLPVGFRCYQPDPAVKEWKKTEEVLNKQGVKQSERPPRPAPKAAYPSQWQLLLALLEEFKFYHPGLVVKALLTEALYSGGWFMNRAAQVFGTQTISQLSKSQKIRFRHRELSVAP
jgi:hypothetical protein